MLVHNLIRCSACIDQTWGDVYETEANSHWCLVTVIVEEDQINHCIVIPLYQQQPKGYKWTKILLFLTLWAKFSVHHKGDSHFSAIFIDSFPTLKHNITKRIKLNFGEHFKKFDVDMSEQRCQPFKLPFESWCCC